MVSIDSLNQSHPTSNILSPSKAGSDAAKLFLRFMEFKGESDLPIDATVYAERFGANVFWDYLDRYSPNRSLDGFIVIPSTGQAEITINRSQSYNRRRFTVAHELGHLVKHIQDGANNKSDPGFIDYSDELQDEKVFHPESSAGTDPEEIFANSFAAGILTPEEVLMGIHRNHSISVLARKFGVSETAMGCRLNTLGLTPGV